MDDIELIKEDRRLMNYPSDTVILFSVKTWQGIFKKMRE